MGRLRSIGGNRIKNDLALVESKARIRFGATGANSQAKKYFNILGGGKEDGFRKEVQAVLEAAGYDSAVVPGPLLLATTGGARPRATPMPLAVSSTFTPTKELLVAAHKMANADPSDPDPVLDVEKGREPKWTTHSLRRLADTSARQYREVTGTTEAEIDLYFGWHEKILLKEMQVHYEGMSIRSRMEKAKITSMI